VPPFCLFMYVAGRGGQQFFTCCPAGYIAFIWSHGTTNQPITFGVHPSYITTSIKYPSTQLCCLHFLIIWILKENFGFFNSRYVCRYKQLFLVLGLYLLLFIGGTLNFQRNYLSYSYYRATFQLSIHAAYSSK
jgi:hypothetical protein